MANRPGQRQRQVARPRPEQVPPLRTEAHRIRLQGTPPCLRLEIGCAQPEAQANAQDAVRKETPGQRQPRPQLDYGPGAPEIRPARAHVIRIQG